MKRNECFNCRNHLEGTAAENTGWYYTCKKGIENEGLLDLNTCPEYIPNRGFQIGGYYSHIHFEYPESEVNPCMEMTIQSDGEFPVENPSDGIKFHICDFRQLELFVKIWGDYFRAKGVIDDSEELIEQ